MKFEFKTTVWETVDFPEKYNEEVLQAIKDGKINSSEDIFTFLAEKGEHNVDCKVLSNTSEQMIPDEQDGQSTIEISDSTSSIWNNGTQNEDNG